MQLLPICEPYSLNQQGSLKNKPILVVMPEWGKEELHSKRGQAESTLRAQHSGNVEEEIAKMRHDSRYVPALRSVFTSRRSPPAFDLPTTLNSTSEDILNGA